MKSPPPPSPHKKPGLLRRASYWFDNVMARGTGALVLLLFLATVAATVGLALLSHGVARPAAGSVDQSLWVTFMHILDSGYIAGDNEAGSVGYVALMALATVCGLFITSMLIGIITNAFQGRVESLRRGRSQVLEKGHTLILGYNEHTLGMIQELAKANKEGRRQAVVVLAPEDKEQLDEALTQRLRHLGRTRVITRSGNPAHFEDLQTVGLLACRSVLLCLDDDLDVLKTTLAVTRQLQSGGNPQGAYACAVVHQKRNLAATRIAGGDTTEVLFLETVLSRIIAQTYRQSGMPQVYQELLDFNQDDVFLLSYPQLAGQPFGALPGRFSQAAVLGLKTSGGLLLSPPASTVLAPGDQVVLMAESPAAARLLAAPGPVDEAALAPLAPAAPRLPERLLVLGYQPMLPSILAEMDQFMAQGSVITVACGPQYLPSAQALPDFAHLAVTAQGGDVTDGAFLAQLLAEGYDAALVLSDFSCDARTSDAKILLVLLQLTDLAKRAGQSLRVVSEIRDPDNQQITDCVQVDDFVVGSDLVCLLMTQIAQQRNRRQVLDLLLDDEGMEIFMRDIARYVQPGMPVNFYTALAAAARYGELAIGYRKQGADGQTHILLNPNKGEEVTFAPGDSLVVLAEK